MPDAQSEPRIMINGFELSQGQAMTLRVALESFMMSLNDTGLGSDDHGRKMTQNYLDRGRDVRMAMSCEAFDPPLRIAGNPPLAYKPEVGVARPAEAIFRVARFTRRSVECESLEPPVDDLLAVLRWVEQLEKFLPPQPLQAGGQKLHQLTPEGEAFHARRDQPPP